MNKNLFKPAIAMVAALAFAAGVRAQPLSINTLAGDISQGSLDGVGVNARFSQPFGIAADGAGNVYVADTLNGTIRKIAPDQTVSTFVGLAGNFGSLNGTGTNAQFYGPQGIAIDNAGNMFVADAANSTIRKITSAGVVSTFAGSAGNRNSFNGVGANAHFFQPAGIAVDGGGNIYVADAFNHTVRKITPTGVVSTLAGLAGVPGGVDGTSSKARFRQPIGIAVDSATNLFVTDFLNHTIRRITPGGAVSTIAGLAGVWGSADGTNNAARFFQPQGIVVDNAGNLFVTDSGNQIIRKISRDGTNWVVTTVAGVSGSAGNADGTGDVARFYFPAGMARDSAGVLYVADAGNNSIRTERAVVSVLLQSSANPVNGGKIVISPDQSRYGLGGTVSLSAVANPGFSFVGWTGDFVSTDNPIQVSMTKDRTFVAHFLSTDELIIDNPDADYFGVWTIGTVGNDKFGSYYQYAPTVTQSEIEAHAIYRPNIVTAGKYDVWLWFAQGTNRSSNAQVLVAFNGDAVQTNIDQTIGGGSWRLIAAGKDFAVGTNGFVDIGNVTGENNRIVVADAVRFTYQSGPIIYSQPQHQTVRLHSDATFNVLAAGGGQVSYQWQFNNVDIVGATGSSYTRTNVQPEDLGDYMVVISNQIDTITSDLAVLSLVPAVQFGSFAVLPDGRFHFIFSGERDVPYTIEASTNLINWVVLTNFSRPDGFFEFTEPAPNFEKRFYRARGIP